MLLCPSLISLMVSVDAKHHERKKKEMLFFADG